MMLSLEFQHREFISHSNSITLEPETFGRFMTGAEKLHIQSGFSPFFGFHPSFDPQVPQFDGSSIDKLSTTAHPWAERGSYER